MVFERRHRERVRSVLLHAPSHVASKSPQFQARDATRSLQLLFDACAASESCSRASRPLEDQLRDVLQRLEQSPINLRISMPTGDIEIEIGRDAFMSGLRILLFSPTGWASVPTLIRDAGAGDFSELSTALTQAIGAYMSFNLGMTYSVLCSEDVPFLDPPDSSTSADESWFRSNTARVRDLCSEWPRGTLPDGYHDLIRTETPALIVSGMLDPVIPPSWGETILEGLSNSRHVVVPGGSHGPVTSCEVAVMATFLQDLDPSGLDAGCLERTEAPEPEANQRLR